MYFSELIYYQVHRQYHMGFITEFKALKQIDATPDYGIKGPEWDLFKITMSDIVRNSVAGRLNC